MSLKFFLIWIELCGLYWKMHQNRIRTKRNDHVPKFEWDDLFWIYVQKGHFWENSSLIIFLSSLVFIFSAMAPLLFSTRAPLLPRPPQCPLDHVNGQRGPLNMSFGDLELHGHSNIFFLGVKRSGPRMSSTTNHRALGRLHVPWYKQPLRLEEGRKKNCGWCSSQYPIIFSSVGNIPNQTWLKVGIEA